MYKLRRREQHEVQNKTNKEPESLRCLVARQQMCLIDRCMCVEASVKAGAAGYWPKKACTSHATGYMHTWSKPNVSAFMKLTYK